jgi:hypothetical protein
VQDARFSQFHATGFACTVVVMAGEMQCAVHHEMRQVMRGPPSCLGRLAANHAKG